MNDNFVPALYFYQDVKCGWSAALAHGLLRPAAARLYIAERYRLYAAH